MKKTLISLALLSILIGCGGGSSSKKGSIDVADYLPSDSITTKDYLNTNSSGENNTSTEHISINDNTITIKVNSKIVKTMTTNDKSIVVKEIENNTTKTYKRFIDEGSTLYTLTTSIPNEPIIFRDIQIGIKSTDSTKKCKLNSTKEKLDDYSITYVGDILEFKCTEKKSIVTDIDDDLPDYITLEDGEEKTDDDISYLYMKKGVGIIAQINKDCIIKDEDGKKMIDDSISECSEQQHTYKFYLSE